MWNISFFKICNSRFRIAARLEIMWIFIYNQKTPPRWQQLIAHLVHTNEPCCWKVHWWQIVQRRLRWACAGVHVDQWLKTSWILGFVSSKLQRLFRHDGEHAGRISFLLILKLVVYTVRELCFEETSLYVMTPDKLQ